LRTVWDTSTSAGAAARKCAGPRRTPPGCRA